MMTDNPGFPHFGQTEEEISTDKTKKHLTILFAGKSIFLT